MEELRCLSDARLENWTCCNVYMRLGKTMASGLMALAFVRHQKHSLNETLMT